MKPKDAIWLSNKKKKSKVELQNKILALKYYDKTYDYNLENNVSPDIRIVKTGSMSIENAAECVLDHVSSIPLKVD